MRTPTELSDPVYHDEDAARRHIEAIQWPDGPNCPYCGSLGRIKVLGGESMGPGWYHCGDCRKKFTVRVGSIFERSHIPLHKWLLGFRLLASSKKGFSAHQLHRTLKLTYKSAWFMEHRIREAMGDPSPEPLGGKGKTVEIDETFIGKPDEIFVTGKGWQKKRGTATKRKILTMVERKGRAVSVKVEDLSVETLKTVIGNTVVLDSDLNTDEAQHYKAIGKNFASHDAVNHSEEEYVRREGVKLITTNTVEGFFGIFKRGMVGIYQHCGEQHLHRYLKEFDFRYSNRIALGVDDGERTSLAIRGAKGKRLTYRCPTPKSAA
jgi:transposase-like protein